MKTLRTQVNWIASARFDLGFLIGPAWFSSALVLLLAGFYHLRSEELPSIGPGTWLLLVVAIDVAHVYSTLYRTYLDPKERAEHGGLLIWIPLACWVGGVLLHSLGALVFWRTLAYIAVFHFMRQQYGFLALYSRGESTSSPRERRTEVTLLYSSMLYPILYWHLHLPRDFHWFIGGDFFPMLPAGIETLALGIFALSGLFWIGDLVRRYRQGSPISLPKVLLILGTALSWNLGIVLFDSDLAFTITNVISHGVPYLALVWWMGVRTTRFDPDRKLGGRISFARFFSLRGLGLFFGFLFLIAYLEEGLWDAWIWREHAALFPGLRPFAESLTGGGQPPPVIVTVLVPLLAVPQATHYVLDGFIWKLRKPQAWQNALSVSARDPA